MCSKTGKHSHNRDGQERRTVGRPHELIEEASGSLQLANETLP